MTAYDEAHDDHSARRPQDPDGAGPSDDGGDERSAAFAPPVGGDAMHATPQFWSGGSRAGADAGPEAGSGPDAGSSSGSGAATELPFWRDETTHVEAPFYRGGAPTVTPAAVETAAVEPAAVDPAAGDPGAVDPAAVDPGQGAAQNVAQNVAPGAEPPRASGLGYDVPGYDVPGYEVPGNNALGNNAPAYNVPGYGAPGAGGAGFTGAHDPWATGPVLSTPPTEPGMSGPAGAPGTATHPAASAPWTTTSTYGAPSWDEPRTGPSFAVGGGPAGAGDNTYGAAAGSGLPQTSPENASRPKRLRTAILGTAVAAALVGGAAGAGTVAITDTSRSSATSTTLSTTGSTANTSAVTNGTVSAAAKKITPSVVTIQVVGSSESGTGSGVIVRSDGYILTNNHVVSVAGTGGTITVQTSDGRSAKATIVGTDATDDLAVIKVTGLTNLTAATFAKSASLSVGQSVVAVGAPLGLSDTVTSGIVSATARTVRSGDNNEAVFAAVQTDAAINPGNSGGALVDLNGNVIGINAAIASTSSSGVTVPGQQTTQSGSIGIGFAIPSDEASRIANELITTGKATHAVLGVEVASSSSTTSTGANLRSVTAGGSAAAAGLKAGDVVTAVDGARISDGDDLIAAIRSHAVKDSVTITYTRSGASHTVKVTLRSAES